MPSGPSREPGRPRCGSETDPKARAGQACPRRDRAVGVPRVFRASSRHLSQQISAWQAKPAPADAILTQIQPAKVSLVSNLRQCGLTMGSLLHGTKLENSASVSD